MELVILRRVPHSTLGLFVRATAGSLGASLHQTVSSLMAYDPSVESHTEIETNAGLLRLPGSKI